MGGGLNLILSQIHRDLDDEHETDYVREQKIYIYVYNMIFLASVFTVEAAVSPIGSSLY